MMLCAISTNCSFIVVVVKCSHEKCRFVYIVAIMQQLVQNSEITNQGHWSVVNSSFLLLQCSLSNAGWVYNLPFFLHRDIHKEALCYQNYKSR